MPLEENGTDYDEIEAGQMPLSEDDAPLQPDPTGRERAWLQALHEFPDDTRARRLLFLECAERTLGSAGHAGFGFGDAVESDLSECR